MNPALPSCLLTSYLADLKYREDMHLDFAGLSASALRTLSREMIELPSVSSMAFNGVQDCFDGCAVGSAAAALCHILDCTPALRRLTLRLTISAGTLLGQTLPLPASLQELDLRNSFLGQYMGQARASEQLVQGLAAVLGGLSPLGALQTVTLPLDMHSSVLRQLWDVRTQLPVTVMPPNWVERGVVVTFWFSSV